MPIPSWFIYCSLNHSIVSFFLLQSNMPYGLAFSNSKYFHFLVYSSFKLFLTPFWNLFLHSISTIFGLTILLITYCLLYLLVVNRLFTWLVHWLVVTLFRLLILGGPFPSVASLVYLLNSLLAFLAGVAA